MNYINTQIFCWYNGNQISQISFEVFGIPIKSVHLPLLVGFLYKN